ncbi:diguanylate cyclase [Luteimonas viscosa]|uniref:diguanylate cyclase n=1 Tax=Luteimonas viscosa TaxID=1132694 RepID=A0A5D4XW72_9GAMM|nr:diguanylate cyclase [Luteimonas viscosa]
MIGWPQGPGQPGWRHRLGAEPQAWALWIDDSSRGARTLRPESPARIIGTPAAAGTACRIRPGRRGVQTNSGRSGRAPAPHGFDRLPQRTYVFRLLGMGLGALCIAAVLRENGASPLVWSLCAFTGLVWPHLALLVARSSASPYRAELRNLLLDSAQTGFWVAMMQFNLLPSVLLFTLVTVDKISTGIPRLWLWSLPVFAAGLLLGGLATGFAVRPDTSTTVMLVALPMLLIHSIAVSLASNRMVQQIRQKNRLLDELSRTDSLTGLHVRRHWQALADRALHLRQTEGIPATLLLLDIDHFKAANDRHGHAVGDDVLRAVAEAIRAGLRESDDAGRYGGDEFGIVLHATPPGDARLVAEAIRREIRRIGVAEMGDSRITASIGMAPAHGGHDSLEQWIEEADAALYRAKRGGRDRIES